MSAIPPIGPRAVDPLVRATPTERVRWRDEPDRPDRDGRRKQRRDADPGPDEGHGDVAADHVDVEA